MKKKIFLQIFISFCTIVLLSGAVYWVAASDDSKTEKAPRSRMIKLYRVPAGSMAGTIVYPGRIEAKEHASLFFRVSGPVIENDLTLGMEVRKGDVLMRIDPRDYEREIDRLTHDIEVMRAKHAYLEKEYDRMNRLLKSNATSRALFEASLSARDASAAEIKGREASLKIARDRLADTRLIAPFSGRIISLNIEKHEMAKANEVVLSLQNLEKLEVAVHVPEGNIPELPGLGKGGLRGKKYPVFFPGRKMELKAELTEFSPVAAPENGTYELRFSLKQPERFMVLPGMTVEVRDLPGRQSGLSDIPSIPFSAVFRKDGKSCVWVYSPRTQELSLKRIQTGMLHKNFIETESLSPGSLIVAAGGCWLSEGVPVQILNPEVIHESR